MKLRNLNAGDSFRFPNGQRTYVVLSKSHNSAPYVETEMEVVDTTTGLIYEVSTPFMENKSDPTKKEVILIKKGAVRKRKWYSYNETIYSQNGGIAPKDVEKTFGIKLSVKSKFN